MGLLLNNLKLSFSMYIIIIIKYISYKMNGFSTEWVRTTVKWVALTYG